MKALVTGGTGTLGRLVVPRLRDAGRDVRVLSRHSREGGKGIEFVSGDLATGEGIDDAVAGTEIVVHLAGEMKGDEDRPGIWFEPRHVPGYSTWCTSRSSGPTGFRSPAASTAQCSVLRLQACRGADRGRLRPTMDDVARHPVP